MGHRVESYSEEAHWLRDLNSSSVPIVSTRHIFQKYVWYHPHKSVQMSRTGAISHLIRLRSLASNRCFQAIDRTNFLQDTWCHTFSDSGNP